MTGPVLLIVAGEKSGDNYGAALVRRFRILEPSARFFGVGGSAMEDAGVELIAGIEDLALIGLVEIIRHVPRLRRLLAGLRAEAEARRPAAAVLIDSPDFNLRLAKRLNAIGVPVLYYISPTVWAWRKGRLKAMRKRIARMLVIFPFEKAIYEKAGIPAAFVGHPLIERVRADRGRTGVLAELGLDPARPLVALMPGSRRGEIVYHMPVLAAALAPIERATGAQFVLIQAADLDRDLLSDRIPPDVPPIHIVEKTPYDIVAAADLVLSACGTANLEAALLGTPLVAFYRLSPLTYRLGARLIRIRHFSIVNILAGRPIVPELIQRDFRPARLAEEAIGLLRSPEARARMKDEFRRIRDGLGRESASDNAALELQALLGRNAVSGPSDSPAAGT